MSGKSTSSNGPRAIQKLGRYRLNLAELKERVPEGDIALVALTSFAVSEINALRRCALFSLYFEDDPIADAAAEIQRNMFIRLLSAKLFEFRKAVSPEKLKSIVSKEAFRAIEGFVDDFRMMAAHPGYKVAEEVRNKATNHLDLKDARDRICKTREDVVGDLFCAEEAGNSYYILGERLFFDTLGRLQLQAAPAAEAPRPQVDEWQEWVSVAGRAVNSFHEELLEKLIFPKFDGRRFFSTTLWLDERTVGKHGEFRIPVFLRADQ